MTFSELKRKSITHELDRVRSNCEINGRSMMWVGFGLVDCGPARGDEILVVDDAEGADTMRYI